MCVILSKGMQHMLNSPTALLPKLRTCEDSQEYISCVRCQIFQLRTSRSAQSRPPLWTGEDSSRKSSRWPWWSRSSRARGRLLLGHAPLAFSHWTVNVNKHVTTMTCIMMPTTGGEGSESDIRTKMLREKMKPNSDRAARVSCTAPSSPPAGMLATR